MKYKIVFITSINLSIMLLFSTSWGMELVSPAQNTEVHPNDTVTIKVVPSPGENIFSVSFEGIFQNEVKTPPYEHRLTIRPDDIGDLTIPIIALSADGQTLSEIELHLKSTLPPTVTVQGIRVSPNPVFLYKLPAGSNPNAVRAYETKSLGVGGTYSDGVERDISSSSTGTTYSSSDQNVVTVDANGKMTAQGVGKAKITVRNGKNEVSVDVIVKAESNP